MKYIQITVTFITRFYKYILHHFSCIVNNTNYTNWLKGTHTSLECNNFVWKSKNFLSIQERWGVLAARYAGVFSDEIKKRTPAIAFLPIFVKMSRVVIATSFILFILITQKSGIVTYQHLRFNLLDGLQYNTGNNDQWCSSERNICSKISVKENRNHSDDT